MNAGRLGLESSHIEESRSRPVVSAVGRFGLGSFGKILG